MALPRGHQAVGGRKRADTVTDTVGSAQVVVGADVAPAVAEVKKLQMQFDAAMAEMGRQRAEAEVTVDTTDIKRAKAELKRDLLEMEKEAIEVPARLQDKKFKAKMAALRADIKELNQEDIEINVDSREMKDSHREARMLAKEEELLARKGEAVARAHEKAAVARQREGQIAARAARDNDRFDADQERALRTTAQLQDRAAAQMVKERVEVERLRTTYSKLAGERKRLETKVGRPNQLFHTAGESRALQKVIAEMDLAEHKVRALGGTIEDIDPDMERHDGLLRRWASSLTSVRLQLGFFSATLRQLAIGVVALGPAVTGIIGALSSLIGVAGTGLAGAISVGSAAMGGFALSAVGVGLVLKPAIEDFKLATAASTAYHKAVVKYGKGSEQAKTAQEQLNQTLKGVNPVARQAVKDFGDMKSQWSDMTKGARAPIFDALGSSIKTAQALLPSFARQTVATTKTLSTAWQDAMSALRSKGAKNGLEELMGNFRASLPGFLGGLGSIATAIGRISVSASKFLPDLSHGFAEWANGLEAAVGSGDDLDSKMGRLIDHMRDIGHLAQAGGKALVTFFNTGADEGDNLVKSMTDGLNEMNAWMKSAHGQSSLRDFFSEARGESEQLFQVLARMSTFLFQLGRATAPLSEGFLKVLTVAGDVVTTLSKLAPIRGLLVGIGAALGTMWAINKAQAFTGFITSTISNLQRLRTATLGVAAANDAAEIGFMASGKSAERSAGRFARMGATLAPLAGPVGIMAAVAFGAVELERALKHSGEGYEDALNKFENTSGKISGPTKALAGETDRYTDALHANANATKSVADARERVIKLADKGAPIKQQIKATEELNDAEQSREGALHSVGASQARTIDQAKEILKGSKQRIKAGEELVKQIKNEHLNAAIRMHGAAKELGIVKRQTDAEHALAAARQEAGRAQATLAKMQIPLQRRMEGLAPITNHAQRALEQLGATAGSAAAKNVASFVKPKDVARVADLSNKLTKLGRGAEVKNIAVKSSGADEATNKLQKLQRQSAKVDSAKATVKVGANDTAAQKKLTQLSRLSQRVTGAKNTIHILANSSNAEQAINRLRNNLINTTKRQYQAKISAIDKATPVGSMTNNKLHAWAATKYQAKITAIDNASSVAAKAGKNADAAGRKKPKITITASASQALSTISAVQSALSALQDKTITVTTRHVDTGGKATGGPSEYTMTAAAASASVETGGRSRKVSSPTMLTGEERGHPEYVIATNPQYRASNERYLKGAANDLGYDIIPAYAGGKDGGKNNGGKNNTGKKDKPPKGLHKPHFYIKHDTFEPRGVNEINTEEKRLEELEHEYDAEMKREENNIAAKRQTEYNFGWFTNKLHAEQDINANINHTLIPRVVRVAKKEKDRADWSLGHELSAKVQQKAQREATSAANHSTGAKQQKGESDKDFRKRKKNLKEAATEKANRLRKIKAERKNAQKISNEAGAEIAELRHQQRETVTANEEIGTEIQEMEDYRTGAIDAPYDTGEKSAGDDKPSLGEQTATVNQAREQLFNQYASNVVGYGGAAAGTRSPVPSAAAFNAQPTEPAGSTSAVGAAAAVVAGAAEAAYTKGVAARNAGVGRPGTGPVAPSAGAGTVNHVTNNFAAPPPDPHTWTAAQQFELGALAG